MIVWFYERIFKDIKMLLVLNLIEHNWKINQVQEFVVINHKIESNQIFYNLFHKIYIPYNRR